jgi:hypothetical protein
MSCAKRHAVMLSRTLRQVSDLSMLFCRSTAAHLAPFILPSLGRPCAILRQTAIGQNPGEAPKQQFQCRLIAAVVPTFGGRTARHVRQIDRSRDAGAAAADCKSDEGRRQARGSRSDVVMSGIVDSGQQRGHGNIDANEPEAAVGLGNEGLAELLL